MADIEETKVGAHAILVNFEGKVILQQRDDDPTIVNPGLISLFGGSLRRSETPEQGLNRELVEELNINTHQYQVTKLCVLNKTKATDGQDYEAHVFVIKSIDERQITVNEGAGFICESPQLILNNSKLTRITRLALEKYQSC